ncbi:MAG: PaaI family thioesterase [Gammaproteobacteria bacterium]|nr:PaaI family thioesterase [Gammaproteobacteria bacterium]MDA8011284.1 PaaI family thioesterase [Gammaproteobacteria bacterium]
MKLPKVRDADFFNSLGRGYLPGDLGMRVTEVAARSVAAQLDIEKRHLAPNGYLHAGAVVSLADTTAAYACIVQLPEDADGFTTMELKSNHLGTAREGAVTCVASPAHLGRTTQVWDARVSSADGRVIALFRCTQLILYPRAG